MKCRLRGCGLQESGIGASGWPHVVHASFLAYNRIDGDCALVLYLTGVTCGVFTPGVSSTMRNMSMKKITELAASVLACVLLGLSMAGCSQTTTEPLAPEEILDLAIDRMASLRGFAFSMERDGWILCRRSRWDASRGPS